MGAAKAYAPQVETGFPTSERKPLPREGQGRFGSNPKPFELLKGHLAVSLRTQKSVPDGLGIDLLLPFYKASVTRYLLAAQKKDGAGVCGTRFRLCPAAWVQR